MFANQKVINKFNKVFNKKIDNNKFDVDVFFEVVNDGLKLIIDYLKSKDFEFDLSEFVEYYYFNNEINKNIKENMEIYRKTNNVDFELEDLLDDVYKLNMQILKTDGFDAESQIKNLFFFFVIGVFNITFVFKDEAEKIFLEKFYNLKTNNLFIEIDKLLCDLAWKPNQSIYLLSSMLEWSIKSIEILFNTSLNIALRSTLVFNKIILNGQEKEMTINNNKDEDKKDNTDKLQKLEISYDKLKKLKKHFQEKIIGQEQVIEKINEILVSEMYNVSKKNHRPIGVLFFVGPTGVGKTETVKELAKFLYDSNEIHRFDMSEYKSEVAIQKLIGAPNGYVGYQEGGTLTNAMMKNPNTIVLFDEIEKADKTVFDLFLQMLDEGTVTSNKGVKCYFDNTIVVFTSNLGVSNLNARMGYDNIKEIIKENVEYFFKNTINRPELLGRIGSDNIIVFNMIHKKEDLYKILDIQFSLFTKDYEEANIKFIYKKDEVYDSILKDVDLAKGARDIRNKFELFKKHLFSAFFEKELSATDMKDKTISFNYDGSKVKITRITKKPNKDEKN